MKINNYFTYILLFTSILGYSQVGINTNTPNSLNIDSVALDINGRTIVNNTSPIDDDNSDLAPLFIDDNGVVQRKINANVPPNVSFYRSSITNKYSDSITVSNFNSGNPFIVEWQKSSDEIINNLFSFDTDADGNGTSFTFLNDGWYEINCGLNFGLIMPSNYTAMITNRVAINLTIQYYPITGGTSWLDLINNRTIITGGGLLSSVYISQTLLTPTAIYKFYKGDKLRIIIKKPIGENIGGFEISKPSGSTISKSLIVKLL